MMACLADDTGSRPTAASSAGRHAHRQLGERLAELDGPDARGVSTASRLRPAAVPAGADRPSGRQPGDLGTFPVGLAADGFRTGHRELRRPHARTGTRPRDAVHGGGLRESLRLDLLTPGESDEPMGEFWTPSGAMETCKAMASAAHVYGKRIVGAEAFTSGDQEQWREHPALLKALGDRAFCEGINRFVFHRYAMQPWPTERRPGMTMGPWGQHYERTQTWWEWTPAWHEYLARCQFLLRQGQFVGRHLLRAARSTAARANRLSARRLWLGRMHRRKPSLRACPSGTVASYCRTA